VRQLLLDTHIALWALSSPDRLSAELRDAIEDPRNEVLVSAVSVWEVEIKREAGRLTAPDGFGAACLDRGFEALDMTFAHAETAARLPRHHGDPFDRMLIAQAQTDGLELVSSDRMFDRYEVRLVHVPV
jgi:PIN domain nuclease of toxin-antitoxin system